METLGLPIAYHKIYLHDETTWVGFTTIITRNQIDLTPDKKDDLAKTAITLTN